MPSTSSLGGRRKKTNKGSGRSSFACTNCRRRKIRCDAAHPECKTCSIYGEVCEYELAPSLRYVRQLEARIRNLERQVRSPESTSAHSVREDDGLSTKERTEPVAYKSSDADNFNSLSCRTLSPISLQLLVRVSSDSKISNTRRGASSTMQPSRGDLNCIGWHHYHTGPLYFNIPWKYTHTS
jgi:hypothetical protein